jgi:hypothetical protein
LLRFPKQGPLNGRVYQKTVAPDKPTHAILFVRILKGCVTPPGRAESPCIFSCGIQVATAPCFGYSRDCSHGPAPVVWRFGSTVERNAEAKLTRHGPRQVWPRSVSLRLSIERKRDGRYFIDAQHDRTFQPQRARRARHARSSFAFVREGWRRRDDSRPLPGADRRLRAVPATGQEAGRTRPLAGSRNPHARSLPDRKLRRDDETRVCHLRARRSPLHQRRMP